MIDCIVVRYTVAEARATRGETVGDRDELLHAANAKVLAALIEHELPSDPTGDVDAPRDSEVERLRWQLARRDEVLGSLAEQCCYTHTWPSCGECAPCRAREVLGLPAR